MKYFAQTLFDATSFGTANTSGISAQYDIGEQVSIWLQASASGTSSTTDMSIQFQVSNDPMVIPAAASTWINEGSAATFNTSNIFDKHINICAQKARVSVTRNSGAAVLTIRSVGKPAVSSGSGVAVTGTNTGDVTLAAFGSTPSANGASLSGQVLTLQPASATQPGGVSNTTQSFLGDKTIVGRVAVAGATNASAAFIVNSALSLTGTTQNSISNQFTHDLTVATAAVNAYLGTLRTLGTGGTCAIGRSMNLTNPVLAGADAFTRISHLKVEDPTALATHTAMITDNDSFTGHQFINYAGALPSTIGGVITLSTLIVSSSATIPNLSGTNTGDVNFSDFGSSANSAGASLSGQTITLQPASATQPGGVSNIAQSMLGFKTFLSGLTAKGTTTNDSPATGYYGEVLTASVLYASKQALTNNTAKTLVSQVLQPGHYLASAVIAFEPNTGTSMTYFATSLSQTTNSYDGTGANWGVQNSAGEFTTLFASAANIYGGGLNTCVPIPMYSFKLAVQTTVYLVAVAGFTVSTLNAWGSMTFVRIR